MLALERYSYRVKIWLLHIIFGIIISALLHSILQYLFNFSGFEFDDLLVMPLHFFLGMIVGSVVFAATYSIQTIIYLLGKRWNFSSSILLVLGGLTQAFFVFLWSLYFGIEPSLPGNFELTMPMIAAGFVAGTIVTFIVEKKSGALQ